MAGHSNATCLGHEHDGRSVLATDAFKALQGRRKGKVVADLPIKFAYRA